MHSFLKKTLSLSLALSLLAGAAGATTLTGLETETIERNWESSLFFPRMEALTGVSVALLTIYDMCKAIDKRMEIGGIHLAKKTGGKSGDFVNDPEFEVEQDD